MKVYTKSGDKGTTSLIGGTRASKTDARIEAYGTVDELSAFIAELHDSMVECTALDGLLLKERDEMLYIITKLMDIEALFAADSSYYDKLPKVDASDIEVLEGAIDRISLELPKIYKFTLPLGHTLVSKAHICRTVCRRAEREALRCAQDYEVSSEAIVFLNRCSDYLYVVSRLLTQTLNIEEKVWIGKEK